MNGGTTMSDYKLQTKSVKIPFYKQRPRTSISALILHILADVICDLAVSKNCLIHIYQKLEKQD